MPMKLLSADEFRSAAKDGEQPEGVVFRFATTEPQVQDEASRTVRFVFSDATVDHAGDSIDPKGWDLGVFKRNPVALFSHMSWEPPIGRASNVKVEGDQLVGDIEFAAADVYDFADTIYRLVKGGFMNAVSVGFKPKEWAFAADKDRPFGINFKKQTLLEISVCPVPCNPNALGEARSLGVDTRPLVAWAEKVLDSGDTVFLPRKELETLRNQAKGVEPPRFYLQVDRGVSSEAAQRVRDKVKRWQDDPSDVLVLEPGFSLHSLGHKAVEVEEWKCGAARDLPVDEDGAWDGAAAEASIFEHAGGEDFDHEIARKGFLAYDASAPKLRGSYKLPFAHVTGGEMKAMASGIRAAASRLPDTDVPDGVKESARSVLDHYETKMGAGEKTAPVTRAGRRISAANKARLQEALDHHEASAKCIRDVMACDDPDEEPDDEDTDEIDDSGAPTPQPPGTVVPEDMTPEERRLKEARDLKASIQTDD